MVDDIKTLELKLAINEATTKILYVTSKNNLLEEFTVSIVNLKVKKAKRECH